jgi:uncharacterized Rmd1/YagE family protein
LEKATSIIQDYYPTIHQRINNQDKKNMKSPPKKKQKTVLLNDVDKAFIVKSLTAMRENKEMVQEYRVMLKKCASICGYREITILKWMKPSERRAIYDKAEKIMKEEGEAKLTFSDMLGFCESKMLTLGKYSLTYDDKESG